MSHTEILPSAAFNRKDGDDFCLLTTTMDDPTRAYGGTFLKASRYKTVRRIHYHPYRRYGPHMDSFLTPPLVILVK